MPRLFTSNLDMEIFLRVPNDLTSVTRAVTIEGKTSKKTRFVTSKLWTHGGVSYFPSRESLLTKLGFYIRYKIKGTGNENPSFQSFILTDDIFYMFSKTWFGKSSFFKRKSYHKIFSLKGNVSHRLVMFSFTLCCILISYRFYEKFLLKSKGNHN